MSPFRKSLLLAVFLTLSSPALARTLVVLSGGYQTCPETKELFRPGYVPDVFQITAPAKAFIEKLKKEDAEVDVIWACYSGILKSTFKDISTNGPMEFKYGILGAPECPARVKFGVIDLDDAKPLAPFFDFVRSYISKAAPQRIYLAGHSYGGWTMLQLGTRLTEEGVDLSGVFLVDAISPFQCPANIMVSSLLFLGKKTEGCLKAPRDLRHAQMATLARRSGWLLNVYQTRSQFLHSGNLKYAGWNNQEMKKFPWLTPFGDFHSYLAIDPRVWDMVSRAGE